MAINSDIEIGLLRERKRDGGREGDKRRQVYVHTTNLARAVPVKVAHLRDNALSNTNNAKVMNAELVSLEVRNRSCNSLYHCVGVCRLGFK